VQVVLGRWSVILPCSLDLETQDMNMCHRLPLPSAMPPVQLSSRFRKLHNRHSAPATNRNSSCGRSQYFDRSREAVANLQLGATKQQLSEPLRSPATKRQRVNSPPTALTRKALRQLDFQRQGRRCGMYQGTQTDSLSRWYTNSGSHV
jgi:hypothetical protein